ncbi:alpha/beta fold hydrolase [Streptosporangium sp. KLBMP 9127]|nr:alpha/beta hydrolase [Streptosporangium sp. KLBMP 9127]
MRFVKEERAMLVEINGNRLNIEVLGDDRPGKPTMVAHHGAPGLGSLGEPRATFGRFADAFRVIVFDARGSGASEGREPYTHEQWVADVDGVRAWAGAERIVLAGGSYGGFIAMEYAITHPDRVSALVLRDTSADNSNQEMAIRNALASSRVEIDRVKLDRIMSGTVRDDDDLRDCWREILPLYDHDYDPAKVAERVAATPYRYRTHNFAFAVNQPNYDIKPRLSQITAPTLVTVGRHDWITPVACSETIAAGVRDGRLAVFEKSGHSPQVEEADLFEATVREFLKNALIGR